MLDDNPVVLTEYDAAGRVISQTSATKLKTRYVYDELGRLTDTILPDLTPDNPDDNPKEKIEYTAGDRIKAKIDIFGTRTEYTYDNLGRVSRERDFFGNSTGNDTTYTYNTDGQVTSVTDARNRTTLIGIDDKGRASQTTYFDGTTSQVTYDALGRTKSETNQLGQTTSYNYDVFGKVAAITNPLNQQTQFTYNSRGSLVKVTDALNHSTQYEYDQYNRKTAVINANGDHTETIYDQYGQVAAIKDGNQHITQYFYNNLGALTSVKLANLATTNYTYDNLGRLTQFEDANHNKTTYEYDAFNRQVATNLPLGQRSTTTFNNFGQVANTKDFNGDVINYAYDQYGRLANKSFSNPLVATVSYTYDPVTSQVKTVTDGRGVTTYSFDSYDRVNLISNPDGQTVGYIYDVLGNLKTLTTSASTVNYSYDLLNRLDTVISGGQLAKYGYDAVGNLISTTLADGTTETRQYDASNRLKEIKTRDAMSVVLSSYAYTLDGVGNRTQVVENTGRTVNYTYDEVNQLKLESITDPTLENRTIGYDYDLVGNRLKRNDSYPSSGLTTYVYDPNNRLISQTSGTKVTQYTYDNNGSMLTNDDGTNSVVYQWINDGENRLIGVTTTNASGSSQSKYIYDASGNRVASITDSVRKNYLVDPTGYSKVLQEYDTNGQVLTKYFYGLGLIKSESGSDEKFYHYDGLGSTRLLTDGTGQVTDRYVYDAFGRLIANAGGSDNAYQFAGEQRDSTGLDYLRARYYNSDLGRFISKDAFAGNLASPISENAYVYANANPVNFTDPSGYFTLGEFGITDAINSILSSISQTVITGALFGAAFSIVHQDLEIIDGARDELSFDEVLQSTYQGAILEPLFTAFPFAAIPFAVMGIKTGLEEIYDKDHPRVLTGIFDIVASIVPLSSLKGSFSNISATFTKNTIDVEGIPQCFVAGTSVLTIEGEKRIEELLLGDTVISCDPVSGEVANHVIKHLFIHQVPVVLDIQIGDVTITCSPEHPFWVDGIGWQAAKNLTVGDLLVTKQKTTIAIDTINYYQGSFTVYNIEVNGFHTYYVSKLGVLVHNKTFYHPKITKGDLGDLLGSGGNKDVYAFGDDQAAGLLKPGKKPSALDQEIALLNILQELGLPTVNARGPIDIEGNPALIFDRFAQGSKDIVRLQGDKVKTVGESSLLNQRSIDDLTAIRKTLVTKKIKIDDLQFLIGADGRVVIADPLAVTVGKDPSRNNLRMIDLLIESARKN